LSNPIDVARPGTPLTPAERRALEAYARQGTYKGAAAALGRSAKTVQHQLAAARVRLGVTTTIEAYRRVRDDPAA
jgi:DNA-binding NarL/FixJ family response regulator